MKNFIEEFWWVFVVIIFLGLFFAWVIVSSNNFRDKQDDFFMDCLQRRNSATWCRDVTDNRHLS